MATHIIQSKPWGKFKTEYGTHAVRVGNIQYTKHKIPFTDYFYAYCGKVHPFDINFEEIKNSLTQNSCIAINFDVPNVIKGSAEEEAAVKVFEELCEKSPRNVFAKYNILLDISKNEETLLCNLHTKHRYNLKLAYRKGVTVKRAENPEDFDLFYKVFKETADREKYYIHPKHYYQKIWELLHPFNMCHIITVYFGGEVLASWMFFSYEGVLYYPYGGSSWSNRQLQASTVAAWEGIRMGKELGCNTFDMWGACKDLNDVKDPWWGFSNFKLKFGGAHVEYIDSYDYIVNKPLYALFNTANDLRWKILSMLK